MSGSDWDKRFTPVAIAGFCFLAILGASALVFFLGSLRGEQKNRADTSYRYKQSAKEDAERACVGTNPRAVFECVVEKVEASAQAEHDQRDLAAQQQAAWAGILSSVWSLGALFATALGLWWIKGTLNATRRGAEAAQRAVDETKRIGDAQSRAWIGYKTMETYPHSFVDESGKEDLGRIFRVGVVNNGPSPALKLSFTFHGRFAPAESEPDLPDTVSTYANYLVPPTQVIWTGWINVPADRLARMDSKSESLFVRLITEYEDTITPQARRRTDFTLEISRNGQRVMPDGAIDPIYVANITGQNNEMT